MDERILKNCWLQYKNTGSFISLMPFLEQSLSEAKRSISSLNCDPFPYGSLVAFAISSESDYWASLALDWLEEGLAIDEKISSVINLMIESKWVTQETSLRVLEFVKRSEKSNIA